MMQAVQQALPSDYPVTSLALAAGALAVGGTLGCYRALAGAPATAPPDPASADGWYARESDGKAEADVFYIHPTTAAGLN
jgi:hypothetical protein